MNYASLSVLPTRAPSTIRVSFILGGPFGHQHVLVLIGGASTAQSSLRRPGDRPKCRCRVFLYEKRERAHQKHTRAGRKAEKQGLLDQEIAKIFSLNAVNFHRLCNISVLSSCPVRKPLLPLSSFYFGVRSAALRFMLAMFFLSACMCSGLQ